MSQKTLEQIIEEAVKIELKKGDDSCPQTPDINAAFNLEVPIGVSARHLHVTKEHLEVLFGKGHALQPYKELMGGQYAAKERVALVGPNLRVIENVRILGPERKATQVELSKTDARKLSINAPIRESGDVKGSQPITIVGPEGVVRIEEGCIVAMRHIHMNPEDARRFSVSDRQVVSVKTEEGVRKGILSNVMIRVDPSFTLEMHIDIDEANGLGIRQNDRVKLVK